MKTVLREALRIGRAAAFIVGLAVTLALMLGVASYALAANGDAFVLGQNNVATATTRLAGAVGVDGPMLLMDNNNAGPRATALNLQVESGKAPMKVNSDAKVNNLNADKLDGRNSTALPGSITSIGTFAGFILAPLDISNGGDWVFAGPTTTVTTNATQSLVGAAEAPLAVSSGGLQLFAYGLCYQPSGGGPISHFFGNVSSSRHSEGELTGTLVSWATSASVVPGAGTWKVGFCVRALRVGLETIDRTGSVNGWVQVVNQPPVAATPRASGFSVKFVTPTPGSLEGGDRDNEGVGE